MSSRIFYWDVEANGKTGRRGVSARAALMVLLLGTLAALAVATTDHGLRRRRRPRVRWWAWGSNDDGETTLPPAAKSGVVAISADAIHSLALKNDGSVVAWGFNGYGQSDVPSAAQKGIVAVRDGDFYSLAPLPSATSG